MDPNPIGNIARDKYHKKEKSPSKLTTIRQTKQTQMSKPYHKTNSSNYSKPDQISNRMYRKMPKM